MSLIAISTQHRFFSSGGNHFSSGPPFAAALRIVGLDVFMEHSLFGWLLMGALAGWLSGELVRGKGFGCLGNILLGLIGAVVGGWLFEQLHITSLGFIGGLAAATIGAVLIVSLARAISRSD
ncbi:MAG TPA: GlsB/YeaQ/YmgE family stress response membrane protein [Candidatus Acidoferrales bacterium]|nr:GlsB/YeaQ/YmgE family stress response membrane protein [Candidatus Acidoferrales bacterium]